MKVAIRESTLTAIGDAIREKTDTTDLLAPGAMPAAIRSITTGEGGGSGDITVEPIVLSGNCQYACSGLLGGKYIDMYGDSISTKDITKADYMFYYSTANYIPFDINFDASHNYTSLARIFYKSELFQIPKINNVKPVAMDRMFYECKNIRYFPDDYGKDWDWSTIEKGSYKTGENYDYSTESSLSEIFYGCYSLRKIPLELLSHQLSNISNYVCSCYYHGFYRCVSLDEAIDLPVLIPSGNNQVTENCFSDTFTNCSRLKRLTFAMNEDGTPKRSLANKQYINLTNTGFAQDNTYKEYILNYNSGITADKEVFDDATYQALKDDPDWFSCDVAYSRYNHDSAVETINSLPDASNALKKSTITFNGAAGSKTDGGAISNLTSEEIAVAAAKGWTVSFT